MGFSVEWLVYYKRLNFASHFVSNYSEGVLVSENYQYINWVGGGGIMNRHKKSRRGCACVLIIAKSPSGPHRFGG